MATVLPLKDASRRPSRLPLVTATIIVVNLTMFVAELQRGDAFVQHWSVNLPAGVARLSRSRDPEEQARLKEVQPARRARLRPAPARASSEKCGP
jgi:hypothetical protein